VNDSESDQMNVFLITASRTRDGQPVYLARDFAWATDIRAALWTLDTGERDELVGWARRQEADVCDPYALMVELHPSDGLRPLTTRERIRSAGSAATLDALRYGPD